MNYYRPIKEIFDFEKGSLQSSKAVDGEYNFITASSEWKKHNTYEHDKEALILAVAASGSLGRVHYINGKFTSSDLCFILTPKDQKTIPVDLQFYQHLFQSIRQDLVQATATGTSKLAINQENFGNYKVPYFDIEHQKKYRGKFVKLEEQQFQFKSQINNQKTYLKNLRKQILQDAVEGKLTKEWREKNPDIEPASELLKKIKREKEKLISEKKIKKEKPLPEIKKNEIPFELPENWVWKRLGEVTNIVRGGSPRPAGDPRFYDGNIPFLKVADLTASTEMYLDKHKYTIKDAGLHKTRLVPPNTLMLTNSGATLGIPKICNFSTTFNDGVAAFIYMNEDLFKPFFYFFLKSKTNWFLKEASKGQGQPNLNTDIIGDVIFGLPPLAEQQAIVSKLQTLMHILNEAENQIEKSLEVSKLLTKAILSEAFQGHQVKVN